MERRPFRYLACTAMAVAVLPALAGCGAEEREQSEARPAAPIVVTAAIVGEQLSVSPEMIGAGSITLIVTNQTTRSRTVTLESAGPEEGLRQETGPISPQDTAQLQADVPPGRYRLSVDGGSVGPGRLVVGRERPTSENEVLLP